MKMLKRHDIETKRRGCWCWSYDSVYIGCPPDRQERLDKHVVLHGASDCYRSVHSANIGLQLPSTYDSSYLQRHAPNASINGNIDANAFYMYETLSGKGRGPAVHLTTLVTIPGWAYPIVPPKRMVLARFPRPWDMRHIQTNDTRHPTGLIQYCNNAQK